MKHKYKVYHFENEKLVSEWEEEEIDPILYLNNYYNFLDTDTFESGYSNGKGIKDYIYEVLKKHLEALKIIKEHKLLNYVLKNEKCANMYHLSKEEKDLLREVML
jgi:hypothetical protein